MLQNNRFPLFSEFYPNEKRKLKRLREFLRFHFRIRYCRLEIAKLMQYLDNQPIWQHLFNDNPYRFNTLLTKYCDNRFSKQARLNAILINLHQMENKFSHSFCEQILDKKQISLLAIDNIEFNISINPVDPYEGYFSLNLSLDGKWIYNSSFTLLSSNKLLIASIQGTNAENAQEIIKTVTKKLHGVRPMFLLVYMFKMVAEVYGLTLLGIPHKYQAKYRFNDNSRLRFNYDDFWQQNNALLENGYWKLDNQIERKSLEEVATRKRAMYRKRYEMLDMLKRAIEEKLKNNPVKNN